MELTMSMFATQADYWKARAELAETSVQELARELCCDAGNETMLAEVSRLRGIGGEPMRVIAVEAIRTVTGCPDIKGNGDKYLVDVLMDTTRQWVTSNAALTGAEGVRVEGTVMKKQGD